MAYITLNEAKKHCNVDEDWLDDDIYLNGLIDMAEAIVANHIHDTLADLEDVDGNIPLPIIGAIKLMIGNFYENREPVVIGTITTKLPYSFEYLLDVYTNRTIA